MQKTTEIFDSNKKNYLDLLSKTFDFDKESMEYVEKRLRDDWEPVPEFKPIIESKNGTYQDQRITFDLDMSNSFVQSFFEDSDESYKLFRNYFGNIISFLKNKYNCKIEYKEFIENRAVFKKNITKIKKIFETAYAENEKCYEYDIGTTYSKEDCAKTIVKRFERIGSYKKSAKKLQFVISFNPIDWLLSSTSENWSSCFNINNTSSSGGYQYCLGLPFLCGDKNRMLLYITDGSMKECMGLKAHHYMTRTWCLLDESGSFNIVKWYPNDTIGEEPVNLITGINNFKSKASFKKSKYPVDVLSTEKGAVIGVYSDMGRLTVIDNKLWWLGNEKDGQQNFTKNLIDLQSASSRHSFHFSKMESLSYFGISNIGYIIPKWRKIGAHLDMMFPTMKCDCGSTKGGFFFKGEKYLCQDCYKNNVYICDACKNEFLNSDKEKMHEVETIDGKKIHLCDSCWKIKSSHTCSCCGKYSIDGYLYNVNVKENSKTKVCRNCLNKKSNGYYRCDNCGEITKNIIYSYNTYTKISTKRCKNCQENMSQEISTFGRFYGLKMRKSLGNDIANE